MSIIEVNNHIPEEYKAPCIIVIAGKVSTEFDTPKLLNGFYHEGHDYAEALQDASMKIKADSTLQFMWNTADESLYAVNKLVTGFALDGKQLKIIGASIQKQWVEVANKYYEDVLTTIGEKEVFIVPSPEDQELHVSQMPIEIPKGHYWLGTIFDSPERQVMYEEFMVDNIIYERLKKMCELGGIPIPAESRSTLSLPIHKKDGNTGEILISEVLLNVFLQYQFARNYLSFDEGTPEFDLGKLLILDPKFCEYLMGVAKRTSEGKEVNNDNYADQLNKSIKMVSSKPDLLALYENNLVKK